MKPNGEITKANTCNMSDMVETNDKTKCHLTTRIVYASSKITTFYHNLKRRSLRLQREFYLIAYQFPWELTFAV